MMQIKYFSLQIKQLSIELTNFFILIKSIKMLAEIPRIPTFPEYMILKQIKRIERDVQDEVIPVSAGIYSEHKLVQKLQAIPKPQTASYQDPIFYQIINPSKFSCKTNECPLCRQEFGNKKNMALQCHFCGIWNCSQCICPRKRYHPRAKENNSQRYNICHKCDDKFLNLTLNHGYMQNKALLQQVVKRVRKQKDQYQTQCEKIEKDANSVKELNSTNKFKISSIKKEQVDNKKHINKMKSQKEQESMRVNVRQKYLEILMRKKQKISKMPQQQKEEKEQSVYSAIPSQIQSPKSIRSLSQSNVYSQNIKIEGFTSEKDNSTFVKTQENSFSLNQKEIRKSQPQEKIYNFYNYHQWAVEKKQQQPILNNSNIDKHLQPQIAQVSQKGNETLLQKNDPAQHKNDGVQQQIDQPQHMDPSAQLQQQYSQDDAQSVQSLDPEVIKIRKAALMKQAVQNSRRTRFQVTDRSFSYNEPSKCSCQIY